MAVLEMHCITTWKLECISRHGKYMKIYRNV